MWVAVVFMILFFRWLAILVVTVQHLLLNAGDHEGLLIRVEWLLQIFQTAAILEVV